MYVCVYNDNDVNILIENFLPSVISQVNIAIGREDVIHSVNSIYNFASPPCVSVRPHVKPPTLLT